MAALALPEQQMKRFSLVPEDLLKEIFDPENPRCPFHGYVGNGRAVRLALRIARHAYRAFVECEDGWACNREYPARILLTGPRSVGKTTFARAFAKTVGTEWETGEWRLPWAEIDATNVKKREEVLERIRQALIAQRVPLMPSRLGGGAVGVQSPADDPVH